MHSILLLQTTAAFLFVLTGTAVTHGEEPDATKPRQFPVPPAAPAPAATTPRTAGAPGAPTDPFAPAGTAGPELKLTTSRVNGLLVAELEGGKQAGAISQMNMVALPVTGGAGATLKYNQTIGPDMQKALDEVRKFQILRQGHWPLGLEIEVSFGDKYIPKDGPSAAVACALLLEGLYTGEVWDPALAVTGDLNADGSVQPVGGVPAKIRGAIAKKCRMVGIPAANERAVKDLLLSEGPAALLGIHIFALREFDHARDLALSAKPPSLVTALAEFEKVIKLAPAGAGAEAWLRNPGVANQLRRVLAACPHHLSAKLLLDFSMAKTPGTLSLAGSLESIDGQIHDVLEAIKSAGATAGITGIKDDKLGNAIFRFRRIRARMHPESRALLDSMESFCTTVRDVIANPPRGQKFAAAALQRIENTGTKVTLEYERLRNNPEVISQQMGE